MHRGSVGTGELGSRRGCCEAQPAKGFDATRSARSDGLAPSLCRAPKPGHGTGTGVGLELELPPPADDLPLCGHPGCGEREVKPATSLGVVRRFFVCPALVRRCCRQSGAESYQVMLVRIDHD